MRLFPEECMHSLRLSGIASACKESYRENVLEEENGVRAYALDFVYEQKAHRDLYNPGGLSCV